jgi:hypothetical protein
LFAGAAGLWCLCTLAGKQQSIKSVVSRNYVTFLAGMTFCLPVAYYKEWKQEQERKQKEGVEEPLLANASAHIPPQQQQQQQPVLWQEQQLLQSQACVLEVCCCLLCDLCTHVACDTARCTWRAVQMP